MLWHSQRCCSSHCRWSLQRHLFTKLQEMLPDDNLKLTPPHRSPPLSLKDPSCLKSHLSLGEVLIIGQSDTRKPGGWPPCNSAPGQEDSAEDPVVNKEQSIFFCSLPFLQGAPKNPPQKTRCAQISLWICFLRNLIWGNSLDPSYIILYLRKLVSESWSDLFKRAQLVRNGSGKNILIPDPVKCPVLCCA